MTRDDLVQRARRSLGPVGAFLGAGPGAPPAVAAAETPRRLESAGWAALWTNEVVGTDALVRAALWLAATDRMVVGTSIANAWARPPQTAHAAATQLVQAFPDRFVFGLGVGSPGQAAAVGRDFDSPLSTARGYLEGMGETSCPLILGANGPKLLALAGETADGALPAARPPEDIADARSALGPDKLLVAYVPFTLSADAAVVSEAVAAHLAAGADHIICGLSFDTDVDVATGWLEGVGPKLATQFGRAA